MTQLVIIYGTGFGNTGIMAKAIEEGAKSRGVDVIIKKILDAVPEDVENADAIAIGTPTYKAAAMPNIVNFVKQLSDKPVKGKVGAAFGSYGWSGEAAGIVSNMLKSYDMDVIEPDLRIKRTPEEEGIEVCRELGKLLADRIK